MRINRNWFFSILAVTVLANPAGAADLDDIIERHIDARGGRDAWESVESVEITGTYTAFSKSAPFTMTRKRDHKVRFESVMLDNPYIAVYDGERAWNSGVFGMNWAQSMGDQDFVAFRQEVDFATPLFDYKERGIEAELVGDSEIDGIAAIAIKLTRPDSQVETWYLDPETFLEIGRDSEGSDFGTPNPQRTFYDDFRKVENVTVPFFKETQWYTRDRIFEADEVVLNPQVDDNFFALPPPTGMDKFAALVGSWNVKVEHRDFPQAPFAESERSSVIEPMLRGAYLQEHYVTDDEMETVRTLSYDRFREVYRLTQISSFASNLDLQEGDFDDEGRLVLSNTASGTTLDIFGMTMYERISIFDVMEDSFRLEQEMSSDGGESWAVLTKLHYTRAEE